MYGQRRVNRANFGVACLLLLIAGHSAAADEAAQEASPPDCVPAQMDYYPAIAIRNRREARVLIEYRVDAQARVTDIHIFSEESGDVFRELAKKFVDGLKCKVPKTWQADGGPTQQLRVNIIFELAPGGVLLPISPKDPVARITGSIR